MKEELRENLKELGISIVYLFGSRAVGRDTPSSDVDIGVVFKNSTLGEDTRALYTILYKLFSDLYHSSKLDIVFLQRASLSLQYSAIRDGKILFEEDPILRADYEYRVTNQYLNFRPVVEFFDRIATERYAKT